MTMTPERRQAVLGTLNRVVRKWPVRWGLGAVVLVNRLLLAVLTLTVQLRWLPPFWPLSITRILFQIFLVTSIFDLVLFGLTGIVSAVLLYRRRTRDKPADPMLLLRRALIVPATYILSILWGWSWLAGHRSRLFGAALVAIWIGSHTVHFIYVAARAFCQAQAARGAGARTMRQARLFGPALSSILRTRIQKVRSTFGLRWWLLTHRDYMNRLSVPDRALFESVVEGVTQNVEILLKRGADPNLRLIYGMPLIAFCASLGRNEAVRLLLEAGASIDAATSSSGFNALLNAAEKGNLDLVRLLVERGANIEASLFTGMTPLMLAAWKGQSEVVAYLLEKGARKDAKTPKEATALILAVIGGHSEAARLLVNAGADLSVRTTSGRTALDYAEKKGHSEIIKMLSGVQDKNKRGEAVL